MGSTVVDAVSGADDLTLVACVDLGYNGEVCDSGCVCYSDLAQAIDAQHPDVMVDFTRPDVVAANVKVALSKGVNCVIGTTGLSRDVLEALALEAADGACLFFAPNFAIGAVLMMQFAQVAAKYMPHCEIIELHHDQKLDSPSGTALATAKLIGDVREAVTTPGRETELPGLEGARGALANQVNVHSVRLPGLVAHQEVLFGAVGQTLSVRHDSIDRTSFMPGVLLACRQVGSRSGLVVGLEQFMEL